MHVVYALAAGWVMLYTLAHPLRCVIAFVFAYMVLGIYKAYKSNQERLTSNKKD